MQFPKKLEPEASFQSMKNETIKNNKIKNNKLENLSIEPKINSEKIKIIKYKNLEVQIEMVNTKINEGATLDSGANHSVINKRILPGGTKIIKKYQRKLTGVTQDEVEVLGEVRKVRIKIKDVEFMINATVVEGIEDNLILGMDFIIKTGTIINGKTKEIMIGDQIKIKMNDKWIETAVMDRESDMESKVTKIKVMGEAASLKCTKNIIIEGESTARIPIENNTNVDLEQRTMRTRIPLINKGITAEIKENEMIIKNKRTRPILIHEGQRIMEVRDKIRKIKETIEEEEFYEKLLAVKECKKTPNNDEIPQFEGDKIITDLQGKEIRVSRDLSKEERKKALNLIYRFRDIFTCEIRNIKKIKAEPYEIILEDSSPVAKKSYPLTAKEREKGRQLLKELEN